jgi:putative transposase
VGHFYFAQPVTFLLGCNISTSLGGNELSKAEDIHRRGPWLNFEAVEYATLECFDWFSNRRPVEPSGSFPPTKAKANFYGALETETLAA